MTAKALLLKAFGHSEMILKRYLDGLSRSDLLIRAVPGMNHIAWQLGHLITSERMMVEMVRPGVSPKLPEGFEANYAKTATGEDDPAKFLSVEEYQELWSAQRKATLAVIDAMPDEEFDSEEAAGGKLPPFAPTVGQLMHTAGTHPVLHAGQFVAVRRKLGLPIAL